VESAQRVEAVVSATRLPPRGNRSTCPVVRVSGFAGERWDDYIAWSQENVLVIPIVESAAGLEKVDEIAAVDGVDLVYLGAVDLAADLGTAVDGPDITDAWLTVQDAARRHGKHAVGPVLPGVDQTAAGAFVLGMDLRILRNAGVALIESARRP
jgi:2-keto-3-deoxy-L-rhamnonate aldolase RhmA